MRNDLPAGHLQVLQHALGVGRIGNRNSYLVPDGDPVCEALVAAGLMDRRGTINRGEDRYYTVTAKGERLARAEQVQAQRNSGMRRWNVEHRHHWDGETHHSTVWARTRAAARWSVIVSLLDAYDHRDVDIPRELKNTRVTVCEDRRRKRA